MSTALTRTLETLTRVRNRADDRAYAAREAHDEAHRASRDGRPDDYRRHTFVAEGLDLDAAGLTLLARYIEEELARAAQA